MWLFFQAEDGIRDYKVTGVQTCALPISSQWGIWRAGGIAVPLPLNSTRPELEYFIDDTEASTLVFDASTAPLLSPIAAARGIRALSLSHDQLRARQSAELPDITRNIAPNLININNHRRA